MPQFTLDENGKLVPIEGSESKGRSIFSSLPSLSTLARRALVGPTEEETGGLKLNAPLNPVGEKSLLPEFKQPETYWGGFFNSLYNDFVRPLATPSGALGSSAIGKLPSIAPEIKLGQQIKPGLTAYAPKREPLGLPPAPRTARFIAGEKGIAEAGKTYPMDIAPLKPGLGEQGAGTILPREVEGISDIPALDAPRLGTTLGDIPSLTEATDLQSTLGRLESIKEGSPVRITNPPDFNIGNPELPYQLESAVREPKIKPQALPAVEGRTANTKVPIEPKGTPTSKFTNIPGEYRAIPENATPEQAMAQWANGRNGAKVAGDRIKENFSDLTDPSLIDKYEKGDRAGRLADVERYLNQRHEEGKAIGLFQEDQKVLNYLRHEFEQPPEEVTAAVKQYVAKNPSIAKTRRFPTYEVAEKSGLTRKYKTIPELLDAYETKFQQAVRNKELYDHLQKTGQLANKGAIDSMSEWKFKGPNAPEYQKLMKNVLGQSDIKPVADVVSTAKNIYLGGGIPFTKYNIHGLNIARSDAKLAGFWKAGKEFLTDPTGRKATAIFKTHEKDLVDLVNHGYSYHPVEDFGQEVTREVSNLAGKGVKKVAGQKAGELAAKGIDKALETTEKVFERPLFARALPALKLKRTVEVLNKLEPTLGREKALDEAAKIGNEFYGGINKALRNKTQQDLARVWFLAPDWLESRIRLAKRDYTGLAKFLTGKGNEISNIGAKSAARGLTIGTGTLASSYALRGGKDIERSSDALSLSAGTAGERKRYISPMSTSDEGVRIPIEVAIRTYQGDPGALIDLLIKNKISTPMRAAWNVVKGEDDFGNPLKGKDKYGRQIPMGQAILNYLGEMSRPLQYQFVQGLLKYANGDATLEEALATGAELPINYRSKGPKKHYPKGAPRLRMPSY